MKAVNTFTSVFATILNVKPVIIDDERFVAIEVVNVTNSLNGQVLAIKESIIKPLAYFERVFQYRWHPLMPQIMMRGTINYDRSTLVKEGDMFARYTGCPEEEFMVADQDMQPKNVTSIEVHFTKYSGLAMFESTVEMNFGDNKREVEAEADFIPEFVQPEIPVMVATPAPKAKAAKAKA